MSDRNMNELRAILTQPLNFVVPYAKDFVFSPTVRLRAESSGDSVDVYFCFNSKEAFIVQDGQYVWSFAIDNVSGELQALLSDARLN
jgi:hypothetical protein